MSSIARNKQTNKQAKHTTKQKKQKNNIQLKKKKKKKHQQQKKIHSQIFLKLDLLKCSFCPHLSFD